MTDTSMHPVAVIDSHTFLREGIQSFVAQIDGFEVIYKTDSGNTFLNDLINKVITPKICIIDIYLKGISIYELIQTIKKHLIDIKILLFSSCQHILGILKLIEIGADGYLNKNCETQSLKTALQELTYKGSYIPEHIKDQMLKYYKLDKKRNILLSDRELEFLSLCASDLTYKEIAKKIFVSPRTVDKICKDLFFKIGVNTRSSLAVFANEIGLHINKNFIQKGL